MSQKLNRGTGLLLLDVACSNPNGDPDADSEPRAFDDGRGLISPVSFKRKLRDLVEAKGDVFAAAIAAVGGGEGFEILESRGRDRKVIEAMAPADFQAKYWDGRVFGNTFLESKKGTDAEGKPKKGAAGKEKTGPEITTGVVQFGPGVSVAPIDVIRLTLTNKAGVEGDKDRGMAPLAYKVVRHALYAMPFFVNPSAAAKSGCDARDIDLLKFLVPYAYTHTASMIRAQVSVLHAWYAEHRSPLGSCPDPLLLAALTPTKKDQPEKPSTSIADYTIPPTLPPELLARLASFEDLCLKQWPQRQAA